jgi:predicted DNA-binding antitoxin AbrB/MazE fold protein
MAITIQAVYENGVLKPVQPLALNERQTVLVTVHVGATAVERPSPIIPCTDPNLIEWAAMDPELDFPSPREEP